MKLEPALNVEDDAELNNGVFGVQVVQVEDVTQRSEEPVSRMTLKDCGLSREHLDLDMKSRLYKKSIHTVFQWSNSHNSSNPRPSDEM